MRRGKVPQKYIWEGKILNKISKKIISLVTMAAFVLTLVPATAFGATIGESNLAKVDLQGGDQTYYVSNGSNASISAKLNVTVNGTIDTNHQLAFWIANASDESATPIDGVGSGVNFVPSDSVSIAEDTTPYVKSYTWWIAQNPSTTDFNVTATANLAAGQYTIYAGTAKNGDSFEDVDMEKVGNITVVNTDASTEDSRLLIDGKVGPANAIQADPQEFEFNILNADNVPTKLPLVSNVYVWVEDSNDKVVKDAAFSQVKDANSKAVCDLGATPVGNGIWEVTGDVNNSDVLNVTFPDAGDGYTIHAGVAANANFVTTSTNRVDRSQVTELKDITVNVAAAEVKTTSIVVDSVTDMNEKGVVPAGANTYEVRINDEVTPSDTKVYTVKGTATTANGAAAENEKIYVSADKGMNLQGLAEDGTVTTNAKGEFTFKFTLTDAGQYEVTLRETNNDAKATLVVTQGDVDAVKIAKVKDGGKVLAGTDKDYGAEVYTGNAMLSDAVQFAITDAYGRDAVGPGVLADEAAANAGTNHADSLEVKAQPQKDGKNTVDANDFYLAWDDEAGVYTLKYTGAAKDLVAGDYSVRVALNNGGKQAVTVNFTAVEFGTAQELVLDMTGHAAPSWNVDADNDNAITAIDDTVALGQWVKVVPKYVDENGLKVKADIKGMQVGINGEAVAERDYAHNAIWFRTADNIAANNSLVGTTVTVKVNDNGLYTEKELTVVKNYQAETLSVDPVQGAVGEANTVNVTVVDADGNLSKVNGKLTATLVSQSNEDANVDVKVNPDVRDGKASIYMESDAAGTADVRLVVEAANGELYGTTFTYTFGEKDAYAGSYVVMTIGSAEYVVNNKLVTGDAAPYVNSDSRTMVPFRVLGETFGATVDWDQDNKTVTYTYGDTTLTMTIGSTTYTVNGEDKTMDTAPVLSGDRTYVPVRFVAEALGYEVTPLYDTTNGTTASVVFQK